MREKRLLLSAHRAIARSLRDGGISPAQGWGKAPHSQAAGEARARPLGEGRAALGRHEVRMRLRRLEGDAAPRTPGEEDAAAAAAAAGARGRALAGEL